MNENEIRQLAAPLGNAKIKKLFPEMLDKKTVHRWRIVLDDGREYARWPASGGWQVFIRSRCQFYTVFSPEDLERAYIAFIEKEILKQWRIK